MSVEPHVVTPERLYAAPNALAPRYARFAVDAPGRTLLTGHSHQAWPDRAFEAQQRAWLDAAEHVDDKWERAFAVADRVRRGFARLLDDDAGSIALASNTHDLVIRFLSALPLRDRPRLLTTTGEFHTIRRQLDRLAEEGVDVVRVPDRPADAIADRLAGAVDDRTAAVLVSSVLFEDARIVPGLDRVAAACDRVGARLLVDAYHHLNVIPFSVPEMGLSRAFITGGGYKYCQMGEGNAFLRVPSASGLRPVITGWFAEFEQVATRGTGEGSDPAGAGAGVRVGYGGGARAFAGATYDPTSHYRGAEVLDFFEEEGLTPALLRQVSQHQVGVLADAFDGLDADPDVISRDRDTPLAAIGGFLALRAPGAVEISRALRRQGVWTDTRGDLLRMGPAPYLSDEQLRGAVARLDLAALSRGRR